MLRADRLRVVLHAPLWPGHDAKCHQQPVLRLCKRPQRRWQGAAFHDKRVVAHYFTPTGNAVEEAFVLDAFVIEHGNFGQPAVHRLRRAHNPPAVQVR